MTVFIIDKQQTVGVAGNVTISETASPANVQIVRSGVPSGTVSVTVNTVSGTAVAGQDYLAANNQVVTFAAGDIVKVVPITILTGNASTRNGNRTFSVVLGNPVNAALNSASTSTVTILDSRPDHHHLGVSPSSTLTGKLVSTPSTVKNIGPLGVTTPFSIGLYLVRAEDFDPDNPSGSAPPVTSVDVPALAAGLARPSRRRSRSATISRPETTTRRRSPISTTRSRRPTATTARELLPGGDRGAEEPDEVQVSDRGLQPDLAPVLDHRPRAAGHRRVRRSPAQST